MVCYDVHWCILVMENENGMTHGYVLQKTVNIIIVILLTKASGYKVDSEWICTKNVGFAGHTANPRNSK